MHSNSHLGISMAAMVHLGGAIPNLVYDLDTHYPWQSEEVIAGGRIKIEEGSVAVPEGPGLGVELDRTALAALHQKLEQAATSLVRKGGEPLQRRRAGVAGQHVRGLRIDIGIDRDGANAEAAGGRGDPARDLAAVGNQDLLEHLAPRGSIACARCACHAT